jgi:nitrite reductase (cytochrome c-552)
MREKLARLIALSTGLVILAAVLLFAWSQHQQRQQLADILDPLDWATLYPLHVASFMQGAGDRADANYDRLAANPFRKRAWAGNAFALEHNAPRSHYYAQIDQQQSRRTLERNQPAACIHCHAAEAPGLVERYGWQGLNAMTYNDIREHLHHGSSCVDCHQPDTMALQITRPALTTALKQQGIDVNLASRREMRDYVCAQCHVEYYIDTAGNNLVLPLASGLVLEKIEQHFEEAGFSDWTHEQTGAALIKIQHPNFELHSQSVHAAEKTTCVDCHMPTIQAGGMMIRDHAMVSPMNQVQQACMGCHRGTPERITERTQRIQQNTEALLSSTEAALSELMDSIESARNAGASDSDLQQARMAHRGAQLRWDFIDADASKGFHAPHEATRILIDAIDIAREGVSVTP